MLPVSLSNMHNDEYIFLMISSNKEKKVCEESLWTCDFVSGVKYPFRDTMLGKRQKHHRSVGIYYGFGVTAKYGTHDGVSYGIVSPKICRDVSIHEEYCQIIESDITFSGKELNGIIPNIL